MTRSQAKRNPLVNEAVELSSVLVKRHYRRIGVIPGWNAARFRRLCAMLNVTPVELGHMVAIEKRELMTMIKKDKFSPTVSLHFMIIDAAVREQRIGRKTGPVMPFEALSGKEGK